MSISEVDIRDWGDGGPTKNQYVERKVRAEKWQEKLMNTASIHPPTQAYKEDKAKEVRPELLDPFALEGLSRVLAFGAKKYDDNNWALGLEFTRVIGALKRHLIAFEKGEDLDPESGLPHIDHLGCCWMFLSNYTKRSEIKDTKDNRYYKGYK